MPVSDANKQRLLNEIEALRDKNDWILDPKHVCRRAILRSSSPSWAEPVEVMEKHYRPIWNPSILERDWPEPSEDAIWAFPKSQFADEDVLAKDFEEFMTDAKNIAGNLKRKNNLSALGIDGIGYLMLKLGGLPHTSFFNVCSRCASSWEGFQPRGSDHERCSYPRRGTSWQRRKTGGQLRSRHAFTGSSRA
jgi:hypothetical protein